MHNTDTVSMQHIKTSQWVDIGRDRKFFTSKEPVLFSCHQSDTVAPNQTQPKGMNQITEDFSTLPVDCNALSQADIQHFKERGYVILRNAVPKEFVCDALREINHRLGQPSSWFTDNTERNIMKLENTTCGKVGCRIVNDSPKFWSALNMLLGALLPCTAVYTDRIRMYGAWDHSTVHTVYGHAKYRHKI